ncbi:unnamed protein product, partial [Iphiclides podalirius]
MYMQCMVYDLKKELDFTAWPYRQTLPSVTRGCQLSTGRRDACPHPAPLSRPTVFRAASVCLLFNFLTTFCVPSG